MTDPLFTHMFGSVPEDVAPKAPGLTPTITLPRAEYDAAVAQARADGMRAAVQVKPLVWGMSHIPSWNGDWHTVPTGYTVRCADENGWKWQGNSGHGYSHSSEAAKSAAEADHKRRILAALAPAPASVNVLDQARKDAFMIGQAWIRVMPDGELQLIDPSNVILTPASTASISARSAVVSVVMACCPVRWR